MDITRSTGSDPVPHSGTAGRRSVVVAASPDDAAAVDAVTAHHGELAAALAGRVEALLPAAGGGCGGACGCGAHDEAGPVLDVGTVPQRSLDAWRLRPTRSRD